MENWLNPKALLDSIDDLADVLKRDDQHAIRRAAETVIATRDQFFDDARDFGDTVQKGMMTLASSDELAAGQQHLPGEGRDHLLRQILDDIMRTPRTGGCRTSTAMNAFVRANTILVDRRV